MVESNCTHIIMAACVQSYSSRMCLRWLSVNLDVLPESYIQYHPLSFYLSASHVNTATLTVIPQVGMVLFVWTAWTPLPSVSHFSTFSSSLSFFTSSLFPSHPLICPVSHHLEAVSPVLSLLHIFKMPTPLFFSFLWQHTHTHTRILEECTECIGSCSIMLLLWDCKPTSWGAWVLFQSVWRCSMIDEDMGQCWSSA